MVAHNNVLPNAHLHKDWQRYVKTWFNQPARKSRRRKSRMIKAARLAPRPLSLLRPAVRCPTSKYNIRVRAGRGFTFEELKAAKISPKFARTIGIAVDFRRRNRSVESLTLNVQRLKAYKEKLILFPKVKNQFRKGDSKAKDCRAAKQVLLGDVLPIKQPPNKEQTLPVEYINTKISAYQTMRMARAEARLVGIRLKRSQEKAAAESLSTKA